MSRSRVLIGDDHRLVAEGLERLLQTDYDIVEIVADGWELVASAERLKPDLILADITMPRLNGLDAFEKILKAGYCSKAVFLTMHQDAIYAMRALQIGATGFVLKHSASSELLTAVQAVLEGQTYISSPIAEQLHQLSQTSKNELRDERMLTARQREILQLFAEGNSAREVAELLHISVRTAENHKTQIMVLLGVTSTAELVRCAMRHGLIAPF
jgi:DNA-binding NarL/FixJ family response regulator